MRAKTLALAAALCLALTGTARAHHPHDVVGAIAISPGFPQDPTMMVAMGGTINLFLMSRDGGYTWKDARSGLRGSKITAIEFASDWVTSGTAWVAMADVGIQRTTDFGASWQPATIARQIVCMGVSRVGPGDAVVIFHSTWSELFVSEDRGLTDRAVTLPLGSAHIVAVAVSPTYWSDKTVIVTTSDARLLLSQDSGATWKQTKMPSTAHNVAFSPGFAADGTLWAATLGQGVLTSTDGGATFSPCGPGLTDPFVNQIAVVRKGGTELAAQAAASADAKALPFDLFAATRQEGVFRSADGGRSWTRTPLRVHLTNQTTDHHRTVRVAGDGMGNNTVICGTFEGLHISNDSGDRWRKSNINPTRNGRLIEISPAFGTDQTVVAAGYGMHALVSNEAGDNWRVEWKFPAWSVYGIGISPDYEHDHMIMLGLGGNLVRSTDKGASWGWVPLPTHPDVYYRNIWSFAFEPGFGAERRTVFALGYGGALFRSDDAGEHWAVSRVVGEPGKVTSTPDSNNFWTTTVALSPDFAHDQTMFVSGEGLLRSTDGGNKFERLMGGSFDERGVLVPPDFQTSGELYGLAVPYGFVRLTGRGDHWEASNQGLEGFLPARARLSPDFATDNTIYVATFGGGVFRSTDRGRSWQRVSPFPGPVDSGLSMVLSPGFAEDRTMFVGTYDGFYRSRDGGAHWQSVLDFEVYDDFREPWTFMGSWTTIRVPGCMNLEVRSSSDASDNAELPFDGRGFRLVGTRGPDHGIAEVWVDGLLLVSVDLYAPVLAVGQVIAERLGLPPGHHVLDVRVSGRHNPASSGTRVAIDGVQILFR